MIINNIPALRRNFAAASKPNAHQHEGKFATLNAEGEIVVVTATTTLPLGVISEPDSVLVGQSDGRPGATLIGHAYGGIVQVQVGATPGNINPGTDLKVTATGQVVASAAASGDVIVAVALEKLTSTVVGQLIPAMLVAPRKI